MLPFFFRHYDPLVTRYFIHDDGSTDGSLALLLGHPKVTLRRLERRGDGLIGMAPDFYETCWHVSRGVADWVIIVNIDEHLHHPDGLAYFDRCRRRGDTILPATGYEMVSPEFPPGNAVLSDAVVTGKPLRHLDKLCVFDPNGIRRINYEVGRHHAAPKGYVVAPRRSELKLLHYKYLGAPYVVARQAELRDRISQSERERGWGSHYFKSAKKIASNHRALLAMAKRVEGL